MNNANNLDPQLPARMATRINLSFLGELTDMVGTTEPADVIYYLSTLTPEQLDGMLIVAKDVCTLIEKEKERRSDNEGS